MRLRGFLKPEQVETIHRSALRVLSETGVSVEHPEVRSRLEALGGRADSATGRVRFPADVSERYLFDRPRTEARETTPKITTLTAVYQSYYQDPASGQVVPFDEDLLAFYFALARSSPTTRYVGMLGVPFEVGGLPPGCGPLLEKFMAWKLVIPVF